MVILLSAIVWFPNHFHGSGRTVLSSCEQLDELGFEFAFVCTYLHRYAQFGKLHAELCCKWYVERKFDQTIRLQQHLIGRAVECHVPVLEHDDAVGKRRFFHEVRDQHDSEPCIVQLAAHAQKASPSARVEHGAGFVQDEDLRFHGKHAGHGDSLLLTTRERFGLFFLEASKAHLSQRRRHA